jgi:hypothetical protein
MSLAANVTQDDVQAQTFTLNPIHTAFGEPGI